MLRMNINRPTFYNRSSSADPLFQQAYNNISDTSTCPSASPSQSILSSCRRELFCQQLSHPSLYYVFEEAPKGDDLRGAEFFGCNASANINDDEEDEEDAQPVASAMEATVSVPSECADCLTTVMETEGAGHKAAHLAEDSKESSARGALQFISVLGLLEIVGQLSGARKDCDDVVILDTRENRMYQTSHIKHALSASCHTKAMAKRSIVCWRSMNPREPGGKRVYLYDPKTSQSQQQGSRVSGHLELLIDSLLQYGNQVFLLDGGWSQFKEQCGDQDEEFLESCIEKELVNRYTFSPTNADNGSEDVLNATASKVLDFLWLGNERDAHDVQLLKRNGITHVLNVTNDVKNFFEAEGPTFTYLRLPASDSHSQDLLKFFDQAFDFIENARNQNGRVFVHCWAGVSRSTTIVVSYLMRSRGCPVSDALDFVRQKRGIVAPNINFMGQLERFYKTLKPPAAAGALINALAEKGALPCCSKLWDRSPQESDDSGIGSEQASNNSSIKSIRSSDDVSDCEVDCDAVSDMFSASLPSKNCGGSAEKRPPSFKLPGFNGMRINHVVVSNATPPTSTSAPPVEISCADTSNTHLGGRFSFRYN